MQSNFNPRSPWGERHAPAQHTLFIWQISIHALREESDCLRPPSLAISPKFQSTLSVRRATGLCLPTGLPITIFQSTLSVRRATVLILMRLTKIQYFNPRSPWGERHDEREARAKELNSISIHALREESDIKMKHWRYPNFHFNPRSPWGERPEDWLAITKEELFQSTLSVRRATK